METIRVNETPVRTSRNFLINNVKLDSNILPEKIENFENVSIIGETSKIKIEKEINNCSLTYGLGDILTSQVNEKANQKLKLQVEDKTNQDIQISFELDEDNQNLIDIIDITAKENTKATIIIKYETNKSVQAFHNGIIKVLAEKNAELKVIIVNNTNLMSNHFISIENMIHDNAKVDYTMIDFGGKNSITNYYSNLVGKNADNHINTIYLGKENQFFDLNYIGELRGEKSNINIEVQGALKDNAKKNFKGTIDFKKGCKKATGNENEACLLLSEQARSLTLPMLLCSEEEVEGNHSSSAGKVGEKELFYIMSRGFEKKEAMKLLVRAKFNNIIDTIKNDDLKTEILDEIEERLD